MVQTWRTEVERPWVGMTDEEMTDVERARADLAIAVEDIRERLSLRAQVAALRRHLVGASLSLAGVFALAALIVLVGRAIAHHRS
ncbi:hypothetical protein [Diaminobutyricibacter sp. McL0608]|uniref:hypothetical protein n=1 Tax=Leifsonia sp. McL0608 TaxID=3143537 RepID=UPI0031F2E3AC